MEKSELQQNDVKNNLADYYCYCLAMYFFNWFN